MAPSAASVAFWAASSAAAAASTTDWGLPASTAFMASVGKAAAFAAMVRVLVVALPFQRDDWRPAVWVLAVASLAVGSLLAIVQTDVLDEMDTKHIVAVPQQSIALADLAGDYAALVFDKAADGATPTNLTIPAGGASATIFAVDESALDVAENGEEIGSITFTAANRVGVADIDGWITSSLAVDGEPARPMYCTATTDAAGSGRTVVMCVGQSPGEASSFTSAVMVSKSS